MAVFRYAGIRSANGKETKGILDAESERDARRVLRKRSIYPTQIARLEQAREQTGDKRWRWNPWGRGYVPPMREKIVFTRQMATLLDAGFPVVDALQGVEEQIGSDEPLRGVVAGIRSGVREGQAFSDALGRFPRIFSEVYVSLVRAGEQGGALNVVFERLAQVMEAESRMKGRLVTAMIYPVIMVMVGGLILYFLLAVVVPKVVTVFAESQQVLPAVTRLLLAISSFFQVWGGVTFLLLAVAVALFMAWGRSKRGRPRMERLLLAIPFVGGFWLRVVTLRISQLLSLLLGSGVPIVSSLKITADTTGMVVLRDDMLKVAQAVERGESLADAMHQTGRFPGLAVRMVQAGERAGNLESMLDRVTALYREDVERISERLMHLVEPLVILVMGSVVAFVVVAVLLPIFEMNQMIH